MKRKGPVALAVLIAGLFLSSDAPMQASAEPEKEARHRRVPFYALHKDGTPADELTAADLEVIVNGNAVGEFHLAKGGSPQKITFLVFDTASQPYHLLSKSKKIAADFVSRDASQSRFAVLTIDPGSGLKVVQGLSDDRKAMVRSIQRLVVARQSDYLRTRTAAGTEIRDVYPQWRDSTPSRMKKTERDLDRHADRQLAAVIISSLRTLNEILGRFPESSKVVHLYSCGIPLEAAADRSLIVYDEKDISSAANVEIASPDNTLFDQINDLGRKLRKTGSLFFLINPSGTRVGEVSSFSGKQTLLMLTRESSGRYLEGADREITRALAEAERGYYEIRFPLPQDLEGSEAALVVRAKNPGVAVTSVANLSRSRNFREMTPQEKQALVLSILTDGLVGDVDLEVDHIPAEILPAGEDVYLTVELPRELFRSEWQIYKVWRNPASNDIRVEVEYAVSESPRLGFAMAIRPGFIQDAVLVQAKTGTILVCQAKAATQN